MKLGPCHLSLCQMMIPIHTMWTQRIISIDDPHNHSRVFSRILLVLLFAFKGLHTQIHCGIRHDLQVLSHHLHVRRELRSICGHPSSTPNVCAMTSGKSNTDLSTRIFRHADQIEIETTLDFTFQTSEPLSG